MKARTTCSLQTGVLLEGRHCQSLDSLQQKLTVLCQDTSVDIVLRLQMLEVAESLL